MGGDFKFDLYLHEPERHHQQRQFLGTLRGHEIPRVGDLLELNEFTKVLHEKYEVMQVHRFYTSECEAREPRVYVQRRD
jgi:hypothetical protein